MNGVILKFQQEALWVQVYTIVFLGVLVFGITVCLVQLLWNTTLPKIGPFGKVTFWQALRLVLLVWLLMGTVPLVRIALS